MHYNNERQTPLSPCPKQDEPESSKPSANNKNPQRCHQHMSPSEFQSCFATIPTIVPSAVQNLCANALTTSGGVWERQSKATPALLLRLQLWQLGAMVKKPPLSTTQAKETRQVQPSLTSIERLQKLKEQSGMMMWNEQKIRKGLEELSLDMKRHAMLRKELDLESFDPNHPVVKQE
jgi:hypothetical protein